MALFAEEEYESAKAAFEKGQSLDANNTQWRTWIRKCDTELASEGTATTTTTTTTVPTTTTTTVPTPAPTPATVPEVKAPGNFHSSDLISN